MEACRRRPYGCDCCRCGLGSMAAWLSVQADQDSCTSGGHNWVLEVSTACGKPTKAPFRTLGRVQQLRRQVGDGADHKGTN